MNEFIIKLTIQLAAAAVALFIIAGLIWLFACHGIDRLKHPEEWEDEGKTGEQIVYRLLVDKIHVPENQKRIRSDGRWKDIRNRHTSGIEEGLIGF